MARRQTTPMEPGTIATQAGADQFRSELLGAHAMRCGDLWMAVSSVYEDGAAEIEVACRFDPDTEAWATHAYFYSFEQAIAALREYEQTGIPPEEE